MMNILFIYELSLGIQHVEYTHYNNSISCLDSMSVIMHIWHEKNKQLIVKDIRFDILYIYIYNH